MHTCILGDDSTCDSDSDDSSNSNDDDNNTDTKSAILQTAGQATFATVTCVLGGPRGTARHYKVVWHSCTDLSLMRVPTACRTSSLGNSSRIQASSTCITSSCSMTLFLFFGSTSQKTIYAMKVLVALTYLRPWTNERQINFEGVLRICLECAQKKLSCERCKELQLSSSFRNPHVFIMESCRPWFNNNNMVQPLRIIAFAWIEKAPHL